MPARLNIPDRNPHLLISPNLHDWLPEDDLVYFVIEAIDGMKLPQFHINGRGTGSEQYCPRMMLGLLIYSYATGRFSSRQIEQATYRDVAVRVLCANKHPDHDTICKFRRNNKAAFEACFLRVLELAQEMKLLRVGTVSVDGTKIKASASKHAAVSYDRAGEIIKQLRLEVAALMQKAQDADSTPLADGLSIPEEIKRREARAAQMEKARAEIEARARERASAQQKEYQSKVQARATRRARGERVRGKEPTPPDETPRDKDQYNFSDPESRIMKAGSGAHFEQGYNAQAAVDAEGSMLVVGRRVTEQCNDKEELSETVDSIARETGEVKAVIADTGYYSEKEVEKLEEAGMIAYVAVEKGHHHQSVADLEKRPDPAPLPDDATAREKMVYRLRSKVGREIYRLRHQSVEPVFGIIKQTMGFRQFLMRGKEKVSLEWNIVTLAYNFKRLHKLSQGETRGGVCPAAAKRAEKACKDAVRDAKAELQSTLAADWQRLRLQFEKLMPLPCPCRTIWRAG